MSLSSNGAPSNSTAPQSSSISRSTSFNSAQLLSQNQKKLFAESQFQSSFRKLLEPRHHQRSSISPYRIVLGDVNDKVLFSDDVLWFLYVKMCCNWLLDEANTWSWMSLFLHGKKKLGLFSVICFREQWQVDMKNNKEIFFYEMGVRFWKFLYGKNILTNIGLNFSAYIKLKMVDVLWVQLMKTRRRLELLLEDLPCEYDSWDYYETSDQLLDPLLLCYESLVPSPFPSLFLLSNATRTCMLTCTQETAHTC